MWGNFDYSTFFDWILSNSLKASVLVVFILLIKFLFKFRLGPKVQYLLWYVVVIALILPWAPSTSFSLYNLLQIDKYMPIMNVENVDQTLFLNSGVPPFVREVPSQNNPNSEAITTSTSAATSFVPMVNSTQDINKPEGQYNSSWSIKEILFSIWLVVAFLLSGLTVYRNWKFSKKLDSKLITDEVLISALDEIKAKLRVRRNIPLIPNVNRHRSISLRRIQAKAINARKSS